MVTGLEVKLNLKELTLCRILLVRRGWHMQTRLDSPLEFLISPVDFIIVAYHLFPNEQVIQSQMSHFFLYHL